MAIYAHCAEIRYAEFMLNGFIPATFSYTSCVMFSPPGMRPSLGEPNLSQACWWSFAYRDLRIQLLGRSTGFRHHCRLSEGTLDTPMC